MPSSGTKKGLMKQKQNGIFRPNKYERQVKILDNNHFFITFIFAESPNRFINISRHLKQYLEPISGFKRAPPGC